jgi:hypothetical protein
VRRAVSIAIWLPVAYLPVLAPWMSVGYAAGGAAAATAVIVLILGCVVWLGSRGMRGEHPALHAIWMTVLNVTAAVLYFRAVGDRAHWEKPDPAEDRFQLGFGVAFGLAGAACLVFLLTQLRAWRVRARTGASPAVG